MSNDVDLTECRECLCQAARVEAQRLTRMFDVRLRPFDLTINQFSLLATLVLAGPQTVTRLAGRLGIHRTTLTRNLSLAERRDLVTTTASEDSRERLIEITAAGRALVSSAFPAWHAAQQQAKTSR